MLRVRWGEGKTLAKHGATNCLSIMLFCNLEMGRVGCVIVYVSVCVKGVKRVGGCEHAILQFRNFGPR